MEFNYYKEKLKSITAFVKVLPYLYVIAYFIGMGLYLVGSDVLSFIIDQLLYVSPFVVMVNLVFSRFCNLCKWHKTACVVPLFPTCIVFIDTFMYKLSNLSTDINVVLVIIMSITTITSAYYVFLRRT